MRILIITETVKLSKRLNQVPQFLFLAAAETEVSAQTGYAKGLENPL
jgi:hypothetical protein